jgi:gas vesicle protein
MSNGSWAFVTGIAMGALAGAAIALLYAPMTGEETRRNLRGSAARLSKRARVLYDGAADAASDLAAGGAELVDQFKDAADRVRSART